MPSLAALTGALCRFLNEARIDYWVLGDGVIDRIDLIVSRAAVARMPAVLRAFCARNELALTHFQRRAERVKSYGLSALNRDLPLRFIEVWNGKSAFARLLLPWIPRPELWLVFDAASEVLQARQPDVGAEEAARQPGEYRRLLRGHDNVAVLDANQSLEHVVAEAQRTHRGSRVQSR